jgi:hypothetical protein
LFKLLRRRSRRSRKRRRRRRRRSRRRWIIYSDKTEFFKVELKHLKFGVQGRSQRSQGS